MKREAYYRMEREWDGGDGEAPSRSFNTREPATVQRSRTCTFMNLFGRKTSTTAKPTAPKPSSAPKGGAKPTHRVPTGASNEQAGVLHTLGQLQETMASIDKRCEFLAKRSQVCRQEAIARKKAG